MWEVKGKREVKYEDSSTGGTGEAGRMSIVLHFPICLRPAPCLSTALLHVTGLILQPPPSRLSCQLLSG